MDSTSGQRLRSLDIVRGLVCVLMAIDHVRVYSGVPAGGTTAALFLTRWVTHFAAPVFCFFAGTGAYFLGQRLNNVGALRKFLLSRGLLLVLLELTFIRLLWAFHVGPDFILAGVIWMLGWCMVMLAAVVSLRASVVGWIGVAVIMLQQLFGLVPKALPPLASFWTFFYNAPADPPFGIIVLYVLVPWVGVMMAGYGFGVILQRDVASRDRSLKRLGFALSAVFLIVATATTFMNTSGEGPQLARWMQVLNQNKYPASQLFLAMTLGPAIAVLPYVERWGWFGRVCEVFGRVPMWYYMAHLLVIHCAAIVVNGVRLGTWSNAMFTTAPFTRIPPEQHWPLWLLYTVWCACVVLLYPICAWYAQRKRTAPQPWMRYI